MTLPVSTTFDLFDWNPRYAAAADGSTDILNVTDGLLAHCVTPYRSVVAYRGGVVLTATAGVSGKSVAEARIDSVNVPNTFTVEFDLEFIRRDFEDYALPRRVTSTARMYVGVAARGGYTVGFLFSYAGIHLACGPDDPRPTLLADSASLLLDAAGAPRMLTIRAAVAGDTGRTTIFIAPTDAAYDDIGGPHLPNLDAKYTLYASKTPDTQADSVLLHVSVGREDDEGDLALKVKSWRLASSRVLPEGKPTTSIVAPFAQLVGEVTNLSAGATVADSITALSYEWNLEQQPAGSKPHVTGGTSALVVLGADGHQVRLTFREATTRANDWRMVLVKGAAGDPLLVTVTDASKRVSVRLETDVDGSVRTRSIDLYRAFTFAGSTGYDAGAAELLACELADTSSDNDAPLYPVDVRFTGGALSTQQSFAFIPDVPGVYLFSLRVGATVLIRDTLTTRYSDKAFATVHGQLSDQLVGHTPTADFIFQYLPDFWDLIPDKNIFSHYWSSVVQAVGAELAALWQNDLSKTISSINRLYQRRWLSYSPRLDVPDSANAVLVTPTIPALPTAESPERTELPYTYSTLLGATRVPTTGTAVSSGASEGSAVPAMVGPAVLFADAHAPVVVSVVAATRSDGVWTVVFSGDQLPYFRLLSERTGGRFVAEDVIEDTTYAARSLEIGDSVRVYDPDTGAASIATVAQIAADNDPHRFRISGVTRAVDGRPCRWEHLRGNGQVRVEQRPHFWVQDLDISAWDLRIGDYAICDISNPITNADATANVPIVAADGNRIFVDWSFLLQSANAASRSIAGDFAEGYTEDIIASVFRPKLRAVITANRLPVTTDLVSIPTLGASPSVTTLVGNFDFTIADERVSVTSLAAGTADFSVPSDGRFTSSVRFAPGLTAESGLPAFSGRGASVVLLPEGLYAGTYHIDRLSGSRLSLTTALPPGQHKFVIPVYSHANPMPEDFWAEVSYFDNWRTIQRNFGVLVGLPRESLTTSAGSVDYLQAVRACWMGFVFGPQIANIQLALQSFFGLPYTPTAGHVVDIAEPTARGEVGRILFLGHDDEVYTFTYPFGAELTVNPATGRVIKGTDPTIPVAERGADWQDGEVTAFLPLVTSVTLDDAVSGSDLLDELGVHSAQRQHTFVARVPLSVVRSTELFPLLRSFISEVKPAYTNCIVIGSLGFHDDVDTTDAVKRTTTLRLADVMYGSRAHAVLTDRWPYENSEADDAALANVWPRAETLARPASTYGEWTAADVTEKYESGYVAGACDNFSGDGSWNSHQKTHHPVNQYDGDLNVTACRLWVPVIVDNQPDREFVSGEEVTVLVDGQVVAGHIWNDSPPVVLHIGAGEHPKIPFGVYSPQNLHPHTYLLLGFDNPNYAERHNYGTEQRLDALAGLAGVVQLLGSQTGATATVSLVPDRATPEYAPYFLLEKVIQSDLMAERAPECRPSLFITTYVPFGGMTQGDLAAEGTAFDYTAYPQYHRQVQTRPYRVLTVNNAQFVPSFGPGLCLADQGLSALPVHWGYVDVGDVEEHPTNLEDFTFEGVGEGQVENLHIGIVVLARKEWHYTHGFVSRSIPCPVLVQSTLDTGTGKLRLEGTGFIAPDYTCSDFSALSADPQSFDGALCGSWVFFQLSGTSVEYAAGAVAFEEGFAAEGARSVLGVDGSVQTSTGHVLVVDPPTALPTGYYDVIVRHYRPYKMHAGGDRNVFIEDTLLSEAYQVSGLTVEGAGAGEALAGTSTAGGG